MGQEQRRVLIGYNNDNTPIYKNLKAYSHEEMNEKIVFAYIQSGRIQEFLHSVSSLPPTSNCVLLSEYAQNWLNRKRKLKETTRTTYNKYLRQYIIPDLGHKAVNAITPVDVQTMLDKHKDLSAKTLKEMKSVLSQILKYAMSDEIITKNPCSNIDLEIPSTKCKTREALPIEAYHDIISHLPELRPTDRRFLALCLFTAMRRGEALGLRWEDIHDGKIFVQRNVTHPQRNTPDITTPKTKAGIRTIPMVKPLEAALSPFQETGYIVGGSEPFTLSAYRAMWKRITETIDMHGATPHVLRHSYLTYAVGATTDFKTIQGISGHADLFTLLNRYAHPQDDKVLDLSDKMSRILTEMQNSSDA